jgi:P-type Na+/K+ transporter
VIVRKMDALEALGAVTDICSDKTGTLTMGKMVAKRCWIPSKGTYSVQESQEPFNPTTGQLSHSPSAPSQPQLITDKQRAESEEYKTADQFLHDNPALINFLYVASLANVAHVAKDSEGNWKARGDPTEIALQVFASRFGFNREKFTGGETPRFRQMAEYPFDSDVKRMSVIFEDTTTQGQWIYTKGAVERVLGSCDTVLWNPKSEQRVAMTETMRRHILDNVDALAEQGLRVLAFGSRRYDPRNGRRASRPCPPPRDEVERMLEFHGLIGLYDPPRPESAGAVQSCHRAGIAVHMLTGDHPGTARAIARQVGIVPSSHTVSKSVADSMVMTAKDFDALGDEKIDQLPVLPLVVARCAPHTKVRMIDALHRRKAFAAMVGYMSFMESRYSAKMAADWRWRE